MKVESRARDGEGTMADETYPQDLRYHKEHGWMRVDGDMAEVGITWFAQDALGEIVYIELPEVGAEVAAGESYCELESVKAVSDVCSPLSGEVVAVNEKLRDEPQFVNEDCYGQGWFAKIKLSDSTEFDELMSVDSYKQFLNGA